jgi:hypothetical protein
MSTLTIKDSGKLKILKEYVVELEVGILPEDADTRHEESGMTLAEVALVHELGAGPIPARMPIRGWYADKSAGMVKKIRKELETMVRTQTFITGPLNAVAKEAERSLKGRIIAGLIDPPNAPRTLVAKKPEQRPLIGVSRQLLNAFRARVRTTFSSGTVLRDD